MAKNKIRVLIVEDSPLMCKVLTRLLESDPEIKVVGVAHTGEEAIEAAGRLKPDIITMDIHMPVMDGFEAAKRIMANDPTPILIVAASVFVEGMNKVFEAISYGALDVVDKSELQFTKEKEKEKETALKLTKKIKILSTIPVVMHPLAIFESKSTMNDAVKDLKKDSTRIVAIASSTGGPKVLHTILNGIPSDFPCGIVITQHITEGFVEGLAEWLNSESAIRVKVAEDLDEILPGVAYIAPCGSHTKVEKGKIVL